MERGERSWGSALPAPPTAAGLSLAGLLPTPRAPAGSSYLLRPQRRGALLLSTPGFCTILGASLHPAHTLINGPMFHLVPNDLNDQPLCGIMGQCVALSCDLLVFCNSHLLGHLVNS